MSSTNLERMAQDLQDLKRQVANISRNERPRGVFNDYNLMGTTIAMFFGLPKLRALWPIGPFDYDRTLRDVSGNGNHLTVGVAPILNRNGALQWLHFNGTTQYYTIADNVGLSITDRVSLGGWVQVDSSTQTATIMGKWNGYRLRLSSGGAMMQVHNGTSIFASNTGPALLTNQWYWLVGRFETNTDVSIVVGDPVANTVTSYTAASGVPSALVDGTGALEMGRQTTASEYYAGSLWLPFVLQDRLNDTECVDIFRAMRSLFV